MKKMRKAFALVMVLAIVLSMALSVSAADTTDITINGAVSGATYNGYKILNLSASLKNGTCHDDIAKHDATCFNFAYTVNDDYRTILQQVTGRDTDKEILEYISAMASNSDAIRTFADAVFAKITAASITPQKTVVSTGTSAVLEGVAQGYWLIEEILPGGPDSEQDHSLVMLTTMGLRDISVDTKRDQITLSKDTYHNDMSSWEIVGDNQIGDKVDFHTKSQVPDTHGFDFFAYVIHDKMSDGLTSLVEADKTDGSNTTVRVTVNAVDGTELDTQYYKVYVGNAVDIPLGTYVDTHGVTQTKYLNCDQCTFHVVFDIKAAMAAGKIDNDDNLFTHYSAILNENADVYQAEGDYEQNQARVDYSNNPYDESSTTPTPDDFTFEYTFKLDVKKTDTLSNELQGAKFVLSLDGSKKPTDFDKNRDGDLEDDGETSAGLIQFIYTEATKTYVVKPADFTEADLAAGETLTYVIDAGSPVIKGLDDAVAYYMYEIKAPDGYNALNEPISVKIFAEYDKTTGKLKEGYPYVQMGEYKSTDMGITIQNNSGTVMPSTGGIGTTLFYVFGSLMACGAGVLLVTKKRMAV